jgi:hypothetical protein
MASRGLFIACVVALFCFSAGCRARIGSKLAQAPAGRPDAVTAATCSRLVNHLDELGLHATAVDSADGCRIKGTISTDSLNVEVDPLEILRDSLVANGWTEAIEFAADGPGTSSYRVVRGTHYCQFYGGAPAWIDDGGDIRQSNEYFITVECRNG